MTIKSNSLIIVFDLDDTLYKEIDFLKSAYKEIATFLSTKIDKSEASILSEMMGYYVDKKNAFKEVLDRNNIEEITVNSLLQMYRNHVPNIFLKEEVKDLLPFLKKEAYKMGLITDGRSVQQRSKLKALGLLEYFDDIIISEEFGSEKPNENNFKYFTEKYGEAYSYLYIGDNTKKDFVAPNKLNWQSICLLDDGNNIHKQSFELGKEKWPTYRIKDLIEIKEIIKN
ncbi:HAD family hydrolase [Flavivirga eckloniae]|uniref:HAD family hydrolase n=1 Tax=Flavivirga eckloniae TaxID=1803846 RepID=A0A2K9PJN4_9FLAO|nr:HAD family hydrolase [Flavivirga eckloniae]AUP77242.1 HAD family hydrolase [Flavivirga eckloniae]